jgi:glycosyltransferase involved in cell wall biosynthesis
MNIGLYHQLTVHSLGGTEYAVAVLAEDLKRGHHVEIVNHCEPMTVEELAEFSGTDLNDVTMRSVPYSDQPYSRARKPWCRDRVERNWQAELSAPYDLFINFAHWIPPFCHARVGVLIVLFPLFIPPDTWVGQPDKASNRPWYRHIFRRVYYGWQWPRRLATYQVKLAISQFVRTWTKRWWNLCCPVLYPPVGTNFAEVKKTKMILSVGRFTPSETMDSKKQLELMVAFAELDEVRRAGWQFYCAGSVSDVKDDYDYFEAVRRRGQACQSQALASPPRPHVNRLFEEASIFWHATGLGIDPNIEPHVTEHFGISVGEAMAAGCVPVVINMGGPRELIQHGINGFLWNCVEELKGYTALLVRDEGLRNQMSKAARRRGQEFTWSRFRQGVRRHLQHFVPDLAPDAKESQ